MTVKLAKSNEEEQQLAAAQYSARPGPMQAQQPGAMETIGMAAGQSAAGKLGEAAAGKLMSGSLFGAPAASTAAATGLGAGAPAGALLAGPGSLAATGAGSAAAAGGMGALGALGTAIPYVGMGLLAGKAFGLFNHGGMVPEMMMGPLSKIRYKRGGGEVAEEIEVTYGPLAKGAQHEVKKVYTKRSLREYEVFRV